MTRPSTASNSAKCPYLFWVGTAVLVALSLWLHVWRLESAPMGFFADEASNGYNAACIAKTGADEYGVRWPVFFRCLDDYRDSPLIYTEAPVVGWFGMEVWAARLPSALFQVLASVVFGLLVWECCGNQWLAALAGFCFSIIPWIFPTSRIAAGGHAPMLFGMITGCWLLVRAMNRGGLVTAFWAGVAFAFGMYAYSVGRPMTVLLLGCFALAYATKLRERRKVVGIFLAGFVLSLVPMIVAVARAPQVLGARFKDMWLVQTGGTATHSTLATVLERYPGYYGPRFLFWSGDANLRQNSGFGGELFFFLAPLIVVGIYGLVRVIRNRPDYRFIGLALLVYPAAAVLTPDKLHSIRSIDGVIFWMLLAAIGAQYLWEQRGWARWVLLVLGCAGVIESTLYLRDYFTAYPTRSRGWYNANLVELLQDVFHRAKPEETVYFSPSVFGPQGGILGDDFKPFLYVDVLYLGKIDPAIYQATGLPPERVQMYRGKLKGPGLFLRCNLRMVQPQEMVHAQTYNIFQGQRQYVTNEEPVPEGARLMATRPITETMRYEIYEVR